MRFPEIKVKTPKPFKVAAELYLIVKTAELMLWIITIILGKRIITFSTTDGALNQENED